MATGVRVVTDSQVCLPSELVQRYRLLITPITLVIDGRELRDGVDITPQEFYPILARSNHLPTTSPASPGTYLRFYQQAAQEGASGILCLTVTSKLSAMYDAARHAAEQGRELLPHVPIRVMDSRQAVSAQGWMVVAAARAAEAGGSLEDVAAVAQGVGQKVRLVLVMDTLHYLAKGGRVPKAAAWAANMLAIKPVLHIEGGELKLLARARTRKKGVQRLLQVMAQGVGSRPIRVIVSHANDREAGEALLSEVRSRFHCIESYLTDFTPVIGTHTGPGVLCLGFYADPA